MDSGIDITVLKRKFVSKGAESFIKASFERPGEVFFSH